MKGIVIHCEGRVLRCLAGRKNEGLLTVKAVMPVPTAHADGTQAETAMPRPLSFAFYHGDKLYARSRKVVMTKGRRYPRVEHWFVCPDWTPRTDANSRWTESTAAVQL